MVSISRWFADWRVKCLHPIASSPSADGSDYRADAFRRSGSVATIVRAMRTGVGYIAASYMSPVRRSSSAFCCCLRSAGKISIEGAHLHTFLHIGLAAALHHCGGSLILVEHHQKPLLPSCSRRAGTSRTGTVSRTEQAKQRATRRRSGRSKRKISHSQGGYLYNSHRSLHQEVKAHLHHPHRRKSIHSFQSSVYRHQTAT